MMESDGIRCSQCSSRAIISQRYSGQKLCRDHFIRDLEGKAKREIRRNRWLESGTRIGVFMDGGAASAALITLLTRIAGKRRDTSISAIYIDDNDNEAQRRAEEIAASAGVPLLVRKREPERAMRDDLAECASGAGITTIACGKSLDDNAVGVLRAFVSGDIGTLVSPTEPDTIRWIYPLEIVPADEIRLYASLWHDGIPADPEDADGLSGTVRNVVRGYTERHPSTLHAVYQLGRRIRLGAQDTKE